MSSINVIHSSFGLKLIFSAVYNELPLLWYRLSMIKANYGNTKSKCQSLFYLESMVTLMADSVRRRSSRRSCSISEGCRVGVFWKNWLLWLFVNLCLFNDYSQKEVLFITWHFVYCVLLRLKENHHGFQNSRFQRCKRWKSYTTESKY